MADRGEKALSAHSHGLIKQGMGYSNMAVDSFQINLLSKHVHKKKFCLSTHVH